MKPPSGALAHPREVDHVPRKYRLTERLVDARIRFLNQLEHGELSCFAVDSRWLKVPAELRAAVE
jgi:hypothetical protein